GSTAERFLLAITVIAMYVASFKVLWFVFPLVVMAMVAYFGDRRLLQRIAYSTIIVLGAGLSAIYIGRNWHGAFRNLLDINTIMRQPKVRAFKVGVGPGTYSSRAFRTFTSLKDEIAPVSPDDKTNVTAGMVNSEYLPPLAAKYIVPLMPSQEEGYGAFGSLKIGGPF